MSEKKEGAPATVGGVPTGIIGIVRGGTTSSRHDNDLARARLDADRRRQHQDRMYATRDAAVKQGDAARIGSVNFGADEAPQLVLHYLNPDKTVRQSAVCELRTVPKEGSPGELDTFFVVPCPRCVARGVPHGHAQMKIHDSHRKFFIDERKKGVVMVEWGWGERTPTLIAGTITCQDVIKCDCGDGNCGYRIRIDDSNVIEV